MIEQSVSLASNGVVKVPGVLARPGQQRPGILAGGGRLCGRARQRDRTARERVHHL